MPTIILLDTVNNPHKGSPSRYDRTLPQHRGVASGGTVPKGWARSPKNGGRNV